MNEANGMGDVFQNSGGGIPPMGQIYSSSTQEQPHIDAAGFTLAPGAERHTFQQQQQYFQSQYQQQPQQQYNPVSQPQQHPHLPPAAYMNGGGVIDGAGAPPGPSSGSQQMAAAAHQHQQQQQQPPQHQTDPKVRVMDYGVDFPKLPHAPPAAAPTVWAVTHRQPAIKSSEVTEAFKLSANERASRGLGKQFGSGNMLEEQTKCNQIANLTGTKIELCVQKDQSLTILIAGKRPNVEDARARLVRELQTQATIEVDIPKEYHGQIIGGRGMRLRQLEKDFLCRIHMPGKGEESDMIRITGPNDGIIRAAQHIKSIGDEMAKQGNAVLEIPREFHPWIRGPSNAVLEEISTRTCAKINMPPPSSKNANIVITGVKEGVERAAAEIRHIYEEKKRVVKSVNISVNKAQHRFIIGAKRSGIEEILRDTDVSVEVPPEEEDSDQLILRGSQDRLGDALAMVYARASSMVSLQIKYAEWMRRHLIGPKGSNLHRLVPEHDKLKQLEFEDGVIFLEGPTEVTKAAHAALGQEIERLSKTMCSETVSVVAALHKHLIGRSGTGVNKLKDEHDVQISIPDEKSRSNEIRVEGKNENVKKAIAAILEMVKRLENEKSRDIIIEHRFHGQVIGKGGENMQRWRKEFPTVSISFPDATTKSDVVTLRGDKAEVDKLHTTLTKLVKELVASNYQDSVPIFREYYKHIVGKNGGNINKIREETQTRIELPSRDEGQRITVIGKQANVEKAIAMLNKIQSELENIATEEVVIPTKIHPRLLANGRRLVRDIEDEFGGVHILFPKASDKANADKVIIRGPKEDVAKAKETLKEVAQHCEETTQEVVLETKPEFIKFLIGRGSNVKKLREKYPSVRIIFPTAADEKSQITLVGKKDEVDAVKKVYEKQIIDLKETVEISVNVEPKHHRHFINRSAEALKEIQSQNGNCLISFPKQDSGESRVVIKGSKSCAESAKARIEEIVGDLEAQVTINVDIPADLHRSIIAYLNDLRSKYSVRIRIPERGARGNGDVHVDGGIAPENLVHRHPVKPENFVQITGRDTKCEAAKQELLELLPITKSITVPLDYHSSLIGRSGESVRALMNAHAVRIRIPPANQKSEDIEVTGRAENVEQAFAEIREKMAELDRQAEDRKLRSFKIQMEVPAKYHQKLIGVKGARIREISARHDVQINIPRDETAPIEITGYETNSKSCEEEIKQIVDDLESMTYQEISVDPRFHPRMIGAKGKNLRKMEDQFKVEIKMPGRKDSHPDIVVIAGKNEDAVYDCIDHIHREAEDYLTDLIDKGRYNAPKREEKTPAKEEQQVKISNAPWQTNINDMEQFPAMGSSGPSSASGETPVAARQPVPGAWGKRC